MPPRRKKKAAAPVAKTADVVASKMPTFAEAIEGLTRTIDGHEWPVMFGDGEIESRCAKLYEKHGAALISLIDPLVGGAVTLGHVSAFERGFAPKE